MKKSIVGLMMVAMVMTGCAKTQSVSPSTTVATEITEAATEETTVPEGQSAAPVEEELSPEEAEVVPQTIENPTLSDKAKAAIEESIKAEMATAEVESSVSAGEEFAQALIEYEETREAAEAEREQRKVDSQRLIINGVEIVADEHTDEVLEGISFIHKGEAVNGIQTYTIDGCPDVNLGTFKDGSSYKLYVEYALDAYDKPVPAYKDIVDPGTGWYFGQDITAEMIKDAGINENVYLGTGDRESVAGPHNVGYIMMYGKLGSILVGSVE